MENKISYFDIFPYELNAEIFSYLDPRAINNLAKTCRFWRSSIANLDKRRTAIVRDKLNSIIISEQYRLVDNSNTRGASVGIALAVVGTIILLSIGVFILTVPLMMVGASMLILAIPIALIVRSLSNYFGNLLSALTSPNSKHLSFFKAPTNLTISNIESESIEKEAPQLNKSSHFFFRPNNTVQSHPKNYISTPVENRYLGPRGHI